MTRVRTDNVFGTITDNPLTNVATTMNSAGLANLAAVSSAEAIIILDPNRVSGAPEIVVVTAHTASATSATIQRGQFGTAARQHALGTEWVHGPIASNATSYATAADDQGDFVPMNAWETWTPTLTQSGAVTKTVTYGKLLRIGRLIVAEVFLTCTGSGTAANNVIVGLPVASAANGALFAQEIGTATIFDVSANLAYKGNAILLSTTTLAIRASGTSSGVLGTTDFTAALAVNDTVSYSIMYEAAS